MLDEYDDNNMKDTTYRVYLDKYGYLIGIEIIENADNYVFLTGIDTSAYNLGNKRAEANVIFTDGTSATVTIDLEDSKACKQEGGYNPGDKTDSDEPFEPFTQASLWNTWCTYAVDSNNVYTLTEVANTNAQLKHNDGGNAWENGSKRTVDKVGQGHTTSIPFTIDTKRTGLDGINTPGYQTVYGNDDSVYIVASLKRIDDAKGLTRGVPTDGTTGTKAVIINGVDSVTTGVRNVDMKTYTITDIATIDSKAYEINTTAPLVANSPDNTSYGAYTLFNDKGFIIATVVVGEDNGTTSNYAYIYGDWNTDKGGIIKESYDSATKQYTWEAQAIVNGEDVVLTEVTTSLSKLKSVLPNHWYEIKYKADGSVKDVTPIVADDNATVKPPHGDVNGSLANNKDYVFCTDPDHFAGRAVSDPTISATNAYPKFVGRIDMVKNANIDNNGKLVLFTNLTGNTGGYVLKAVGNTLQVNTDTRNPGRDEGFSVAATAKIWLFQDVYATINGWKRMDSKQYCGEGQTGLTTAINYLKFKEKYEITNNKWGFVLFVVTEGEEVTNHFKLVKFDAATGKWVAAYVVGGQVQWKNTYVFTDKTSTQYTVNYNFTAPDLVLVDVKGAVVIKDKDSFDKAVSLGYSRVLAGGTTYAAWGEDDGHAAIAGKTKVNISTNPTLPWLHIMCVAGEDDAIGGFKVEIKANGTTVATKGGASGQLKDVWSFEDATSTHTAHYAMTPDSSDNTQFVTAQAAGTTVTYTIVITPVFVAAADPLELVFADYAAQTFTVEYTAPAAAPVE